MSSRSVAALCLALAACSASQPAAPTVTVPAATTPVVAEAAAPTVTVPAATASTPVANYTYGLSIGTFAGDAPPGKVLEDLAGAVNVKPCMVGLKARGVAKMGTLRVSLTIDRRGNVKAPAVVADPVQDSAVRPVRRRGAGEGDRDGRGRGEGRVRGRGHLAGGDRGEPDWRHQVEGRRYRDPHRLAMATTAGAAAATPAASTAAASR